MRLVQRAAVTAGRTSKLAARVSQLLSARTSAETRLDAQRVGTGAAGAGAGGEEIRPLRLGAANADGASADGGAPVRKDPLEQPYVHVVPQPSPTPTPTPMPESRGRPPQPSQPPTTQKQKPGGDGDGGNAGGGSFFSGMYDFIPSSFKGALAAVTALCGVVALEVFTPAFDEPLFAFWLLRSTGPAEKATWVSREAVEGHFDAYLHAPPGTVCIVAGPKGTGKSCAAVHAVLGKRGVAYVDVTKGEHLISKLLPAVGMPRLGRHAAVDRPQLARMCEAAAGWRRWWTGDEYWLPAIVVEVERTTEPGLVKEVVQTLKYLAHDARACRAILVLSDANAALGLDLDPARRTVFWLGDFSRAEANAYLDAAKALVGERKLRDEVLGVTTRPADLADVCAKLSAAPAESSAPTVRKFVEAKLAEAKERVGQLLKRDDSKKNPEMGLHFRQLFKDMLKNGGSLSSAEAPYMAPPEDAAPHFKVHEAIIYDLTTFEYRFNTPADMHAAAKLC